MSLLPPPPFEGGVDLGLHLAATFFLIAPLAGLIWGYMKIHHIPEHKAEGRAIHSMVVALSICGYFWHWAWVVAVALAFAPSLKEMRKLWEDSKC